MATRVLVLQSYRPPPWAAWRRRCIASVKDWAAAQGYAYRFIGDALFDPIPEDLKRAFLGVLLPLTDLGRLLWLRDLLARDWDRVIWLDADILIFDPALRIEADCVGREVWISKGLTEGFRAAESVNNCVISASAGAPLLDRLLTATLDEAAQFAHPPHPRALGPDLFRRLHAGDALPVAADIAMASPVMIDGLARDDPAAMAAHHAVWGGTVRAVNLCGSLIRDDALALAAVTRLLQSPDNFAPDVPPPPVEAIRFA